MADLTTIVIMGASGDLTQRKLMPALFNLCRKKKVPGDFVILGLATRPWSDDEFRSAMRAAVDAHADYKFTEEEWDKFSKRLHYHVSDFTKMDAFKELSGELSKLEDRPANRLFYLATLPRLYADIVKGLGMAGLCREENGWCRVVVEKPFGEDLQTARALNKSMHRVLHENQIYRIDHYLGKETVQNLLVFRFANAIFEPIWNRNYIDHVQITVAETVGVEHRGAYYEESGVLRDMFQNHLLQILNVLAIEPPALFEADALRNEKVKVLMAIRPIAAANVAEHLVRGQYRGYRDEENVAKDSETPTYAALRLYVDNWRWQGVPFYLRSGKSLPQRTTHIAIAFKCPPHLMFQLPPDDHIRPNLLVLCLQPNEGIHLRFEAKQPDTANVLRSVDMDFRYGEDFGKVPIPDAYERLLLDAVLGDASLFTRNDEVELAWSLIDPIREGTMAESGPPLFTYDPGTWGPPEAREFMARDGRSWLNSCKALAQEDGEPAPRTPC